MRARWLTTLSSLRQRKTWSASQNILGRDIALIIKSSILWQRSLGLALEIYSNSVGENSLWRPLSCFSYSSSLGLNLFTERASCIVTLSQKTFSWVWGRIHILPTWSILGSQTIFWIKMETTSNFHRSATWSGQCDMPLLILTLGWSCHGEMIW